VWWVGIIEAAGNLAAVTVLGWRIRSTWKTRWWSLLALQATGALWFTSNVFYAVYFVMWERFEIDWWSGFHYDLTKGGQQIAIMLLPLVTLNLIGQVFKDYAKTARRLSNVHD
jgi:hypothetical protein